MRCGAFCLAVALLCTSATAAEPLVVVVMDPLAAPLSCPCVAGHAQRDYDRLARWLTDRLGRKVKLAFGDELGKAALKTGLDAVDLVIGPQSVVRADAKRRGLELTALCALSDRQGVATLTGQFVVKRDDPAQSFADLKDYKLFLGPEDVDERHSAALAVLAKFKIEPGTPLDTYEGSSDAVAALLEHDGPRRAAVVISSYALALLEGCKTVPKGAVRVIGQTEPVPFVTVFATRRIGAEEAKRLTAVLLAVKDDAKLLEGLESKQGFVAP